VTMTHRVRLLPLLCLLLAWAGTAMAAIPAIGQKAPDFTLRASTGKNLKLSELRGQVVMINFWASWCAPCRQEMPHLNRFYEQYRKAGFTLLGVNVDDQAAVAEGMARDLNIVFPVLFDSNKQVSRRYDVDAMPSTVLIDRDGKVRHVFRGYRTGTEQHYEAAIRELIKQ
jgi:peroxiredoxin